MTKSAKPEFAEHETHRIDIVVMLSPVHDKLASRPKGGENDPFWQSNVDVLVLYCEICS